MITLGKKGNLAAIRKAAQTVRTKEALSKLFNDLAPLFAARNGGYTRIIHYKNRHGDHAPMAIIEWTESAAVVEPEEKTTKKKAAEKKASEKKALEKKAAPKKKALAKKADEKKAEEKN
jgi:large subunit ribosomal protein L17